MRWLIRSWRRYFSSWLVTTQGNGWYGYHLKFASFWMLLLITPACFCLLRNFQYFECMANLTWPQAKHWQNSLRYWDQLDYWTVQFRLSGAISLWRYSFFSLRVRNQLFPHRFFFTVLRLKLHGRNILYKRRGKFSYITKQTERFNPPIESIIGADHIKHTLMSKHGMNGNKHCQIPSLDLPFLFYSRFYSSYGLQAQADQYYVNYYARRVYASTSAASKLYRRDKGAHMRPLFFNCAMTVNT